MVYLYKHTLTILTSYHTKDIYYHMKYSEKTHQNEKDELFSLVFDGYGWSLQEKKKLTREKKN